MNQFKDYLFKNFESVFILLILVSVSLVNYFIYSKIAFLNFYYLPIMVAGYYLGKRLAVLGAFLTGLMVWVFVLVDEEKFITQSGSFDLYFNLTVWMCFLILAGWLIGSVSEKFKQEYEKSLQLQKDLTQEKERLDISNQQLNEHSAQLETRVAERTEELERSHHTIETLKSKVEEALYSVMDINVARMMIEGKLRNEKRRISILFSDLKDFTSR